ELALPQAPGLSSASRAFSPSSVLGPWPDSDAVVNAGIEPSEQLSEIGTLLAPEWSLALTIQANPDAYVETETAQSNAVSRTASPQVDGKISPADALAHAPAVPADSPTTGGSA